MYGYERMIGRRGGGGNENLNGPNWTPRLLQSLWQASILSQRKVTSKGQTLSSGSFAWCCKGKTVKWLLSPLQASGRLHGHHTKNCLKVGLFQIFIKYFDIHNLFINVLNTGTSFSSSQTTYQTINKFINKEKNTNTPLPVHQTILILWNKILPHL